jgi:hypothetical protein
MYRNPPINLPDILEIIKKYNEIKFVYLRLRRQDEFRFENDLPIPEFYVFPKNWIQIEYLNYC